MSFCISQRERKKHLNVERELRALSVVSLSFNMRRRVESFLLHPSEDHRARLITFELHAV